MQTGNWVGHRVMVVDDVCVTSCLMTSSTMCERVLCMLYLCC